MSDSLADAIGRLAETIVSNRDAIRERLGLDPLPSDTPVPAIFMDDVVCPACGSDIKLYQKHEFGYCDVCASKVPYSAAKKCELSQELIDHLSGDDYYALMKKLKKASSVDVMKLAAQKGSVIAAIDAGNFYINKEEFEQGRECYALAAAAGNADGQIGAFFCESVPYMRCDGSDPEKISQLIYKMKWIDWDKVTIYTKEALEQYCADLEEGRRQAEQRIIEREEARRRIEEASSYSSSSDDDFDRRWSDIEDMRLAKQITANSHDPNYDTESFPSTDVESFPSPGDIW